MPRRLLITLPATLAALAVGLAPVPTATAQGVSDTLDVDVSIVEVQLPSVGGRTACGAFIVGEHKAPNPVGAYRYYEQTEDGWRVIGFGKYFTDYPEITAQTGVPGRDDPWPDNGVRRLFHKRGSIVTYAGSDPCDAPWPYTDSSGPTDSVSRLLPTGRVIAVYSSLGPVAAFSWEQTDGLTVRFDASDSWAPTPDGQKGPVSSYRWDWEFPRGVIDIAANPVIEHTFPEPGYYEVSLVVYDAAGKEGSVRKYVTVADRRLSARSVPVEPGARYGIGDTLVVETTVENVGIKEVYDVAVPQTVVAKADLSELPPGVRRSSRALMVSVGTRDPVEQAVLGVGEAIIVRDSFRVEALDEYEAPDDPDPFVLESRAFANAPYDITASTGGETPIDVVDIQRPCDDGACETWTLGPSELTVTVTAFTADGANPGSVRSGVTFFPGTGAGAAFGDPLNPEAGCVSGCLKLDVEVRDDDGPVEGAVVILNLPEAPPAETATQKPLGHWLVSRDGEADNGSFITLTANEQGLAEAFYYTPGVTEPHALTFVAEVEKEGVRGRGERSITVEPQEIGPIQWTADEFTTTYLRTLGLAYQTAAGAAQGSPGELCEGSAGWVRANWGPFIRDEQIDQASPVRRNTTMWLSTVAVNGFCGWLVEKVEAAIRGAGPGGISPINVNETMKAVLRGNLATAFNQYASQFGDAGDLKKFAQTHLFLYTVGELGYANRLLGFALPLPEPDPVFVSFQGDFHDAAIDHVVEAFTSTVAASEAGTRMDVEVTFHEMTARNVEQGTLGVTGDPLLGSTMTFTPSSGEAMTFQDRSRIQYQPSVFLDPDPGTAGWLQEAVATVGGSLPAGAGEFVLFNVDQLSQAIAGAFVQITGGGQSEVNQITGTGGGSGRRSGDGVDVALAAPTLFAYPEGAEVRVLMWGEPGPPAPPTPVYAVGESDVATLTWLAGPSPALRFDVEVATDSLFTDVVVSEAVSDVLSLDVDVSVFSREAAAFWRVRSVNLAGPGSWSGWLPLLAAPPVSAEDDAPGSDLATAVGLPFPNPTPSGATVPVTLAEAGHVRVAVYDVLGREVAVARDGVAPAGRLAVPIGGGLAPGAYVVRVTAPGVTEARRLTVSR